MQTADSRRGRAVGDMGWKNARWIGDVREEMGDAWRRGDSGVQEAMDG